jgi:1,5-anhydro-D-fructose reductase (1,5-anhydro-D-mannitol-forming)
MSEKLKIAMLSGWHVHAVEYGKTVNSHPSAQVVAVWDELPDRGEKWAKELNAEFVSDYRKILARKDIDGVVVDSATNMHKELIIAAARAGKNVFTEKVLATSLKDAREIAKEVRASKIHFTISFPRRTFGFFVLAKKLIASGELGEISMLRIRIAHGGSIGNWLPPHFYNAKECGGGAMIDLGAHGMYLARWLLGKPVKITSTFNNLTDREVEDNAISVIEFENKALAINETSFVSWGGSNSIEIDGTKGGFIRLSPTDVRVRSGADKTWKAVDPLPLDEEMPIPRWLNSIINKNKDDFGMGIDAAVELSEMMEAAYLSHKEQRTVFFNELGD